ncbi:MAG: ABC transporter substrate-binding protein [Planctomycetota bacterium]
MDNRFGFKDLVLASLLVVLIVSVWLAMKQFDRQWDKVEAIETQISQLITEQAQTRKQVFELTDQLESGVVLQGGATRADAGDGRSAAALPDPFDRLEAIHEIPGYAEGDAVIDAFGTSVARVTPLVTSDAYGRAVGGYVFESLISRDPETLENVPWIARSWTIEDNAEAWRAYVEERLADPLTEDEVRAEAAFPAEEDESAQNAYVEKRLAEGRRIGDVIEEPGCPDAATITFFLRRGVTFSDGTPLTARDVVFSWELMNNPEINAPSIRQFYDNLKSCEAVDERTVRFAIKRPHYEALGHAGGRAVLPEHFYSRFTPEEINRTPGLVMGSGPYRMPDPESWAPGRPIELLRNERYWGVRPAFDRVVFREISNDVARLTAFRNGEIDIFAAQAEQYQSLVNDPAVMGRAQAYAYDTVPTGYNFIAWNQRERDGSPSKFADKRVRQAMTFLTERQRMCEDLYLGYAVPAAGPFAPGSRQADPELNARPFDVERGRALLREAGWDDRDGDGVIENAAGEPLRFKLTYPSGSDLYNRMVLFLKDSYARAGVVMVPDPLEFSVMLERLDNQDFDAITLGWGGGAVERDIRQTFHVSQANKGGDNFMGYINPELSDLIDRARETLDEDERMAIWRQTHRILWEDQPYTFMFNRQTLWVIDGRFENVNRVTAGLNDRSEWFTPQAEQVRTR